LTNSFHIRSIAHGSNRNFCGHEPGFLASGHEPDFLAGGHEPGHLKKVDPFFAGKWPKTEEKEWYLQAAQDHNGTKWTLFLKVSIKTGLRPSNVCLEAKKLCPQK